MSCIRGDSSRPGAPRASDDSVLLQGKPRQAAPPPAIDPRYEVLSQIVQIISYSPLLNNIFRYVNGKKQNSTPIIEFTRKTKRPNYFLTITGNLQVFAEKASTCSGGGSCQFDLRLSELSVSGLFSIDERQ